MLWAPSLHRDGAFCLGVFTDSDCQAFMVIISKSVTFRELRCIQGMKTLALSTLALTFNVGTFINVELAFCVLSAAGVLMIAIYDYAPHRMVTGLKV